MKGEGLGKEEPALILRLAIGAVSICSPVCLLASDAASANVNNWGWISSLVSWICLFSGLLDLSVLSVTWPLMLPH